MRERDGLERALAGVDASRRVGWAKFYSQSERAAMALVALMRVAPARDEDWRVYVAGVKQWLGPDSTDDGRRFFDSLWLTAELLAESLADAYPTHEKWLDAIRAANTTLSERSEL